MDWDELAFLNQQLAGMLKSGIPLEGALGKLSAEMRRGHLRTELESLKSDLSTGTHLATAIQRRKLPEIYRHLVAAGARSGDLPGALQEAADHYQEGHSLRSRWRAALVYPCIVVLVSLIFSTSFFFFSRMQRENHAAWVGNSSQLLGIEKISLAFLVVPIIGAVLVALAVCVPALRRRWQWRVPGFRDANVARFAGSVSRLLTHGTPLPEVLALMGSLESVPSVKSEIQGWQNRVTSGVGSVADVLAGPGPFPDLFRWLVASSGDRLAEGFQRAAVFYRDRAHHRFDILLHALVPVLTLLVGLFSVLQVAATFLYTARLLDLMGGGLE